MKRISLLLTLSLFVGFSATAQGNDDLHVANIKTLEGTVSILRENSVLPVKPGMQLFSSDTIISAPNSSAGVIFTDGTSLAVGPSSEIKIENYIFEPNDQEYDFSLYMKKGSALFSTGKLGKLSPESVKINTPRATVGVRGTRFIVNVD